MYYFSLTINENYSIQDQYGTHTVCMSHIQKSWDLNMLVCTALTVCTYSSELVSKKVVHLQTVKHEYITTL